MVVVSLALHRSFNIGILWSLGFCVCQTRFKSIDVAVVGIVVVAVVVIVAEWGESGAVLFDVNICIRSNFKGGESFVSIFAANENYGLLLFLSLLLFVLLLLLLVIAQN